MRAETYIHGFKIKRVRELPELEGRLWEMTHEKTGAELCWLDRADENKVFSIAFKTLPEDSPACSTFWSTRCCAAQISIR